MSDGAWYRSIDCPNCGRHRVMGPGSGYEEDGVCEKCRWDVDGDNYATVTRASACCITCGSSDTDPETGTCNDGLAHHLMHVAYPERRPANVRITEVAC